MPYYTNNDDDVDDFTDYDPTPYSGGYDITVTYGRSIPPSDETCYPLSSRAGDAFEYQRPVFSSSVHEPSAYGDQALKTDYSSYARPVASGGAHVGGGRTGGSGSGGSNYGYGGKPNSGYGGRTEVEYGGKPNSGFGGRTELEYGRKPESEYGSGYGGRTESDDGDFKKSSHGRHKDDDGGHKKYVKLKLKLKLKLLLCSLMEYCIV